MFNEAYNHFQIITSAPKIKENNLINTNPATQSDDRVLKSYQTEQKKKNNLIRSGHER